jgi:hypothetical protein
MDDFDSVKDSGDRTEFDTGSVRDRRTGKGRFDLIPTHPMRRLARHYENGAVKYGDRNWEKGQPLSSYLDSAERHLLAVKDGDADEDHAAAVVWNLFGYMFTKKRIEECELPVELDNLGHCVADKEGVAWMTMDEWKAQQEGRTRFVDPDYSDWASKIRDAIKRFDVPDEDIISILHDFKNYTSKRVTEEEYDAMEKRRARRA